VSTFYGSPVNLGRDKTSYSRLPGQR